MQVALSFGNAEQGWNICWWKQRKTQANGCSPRAILKKVNNRGKLQYAKCTKRRVFGQGSAMIRIWEVYRSRKMERMSPFNSFSWNTPAMDLNKTGIEKASGGLSNRQKRSTCRV